MQDINPNVEKLLAIEKIEQRSSEWYIERDKRLTASDVASVLDENPYKKKEKLFLEKLGIGEKFTGNFYTQHGQDNEDKAIEKYIALHPGIQVFSFGLLLHPMYEQLGGSPDGITNTGILLEIKVRIFKLSFNLQISICIIRTVRWGVSIRSRGS
jgi:putative phage-type endonuclease